MIFGHEDKKELFIKLVKNGSLGHAYLFYGDPQIGKFFFVKHLANFLEFGKFEPPSSQLVDSLFLEPDSEDKIGIDTFREVKKVLYSKPFRSPKKLVAVNEAEKITEEAQSSILKIVEESPPHITFVFITHDPQSIIPPFISRLTKIYFPRFSKKEVADFLIYRCKLDKQEAARVAEVSFGRIGRALQITGAQKSEKEESSLKEYIRNKIVNLYFADRVKNANVLSWLLDKELEATRFNLNTNLQKKALDYRLR